MVVLIGSTGSLALTRSSTRATWQCRPQRELAFPNRSKQDRVQQCNPDNKQGSRHRQEITITKGASIEYPGSRQSPKHRRATTRTKGQAKTIQGTGKGSEHRLAEYMDQGLGNKQTSGQAMGQSTTRQNQEPGTKEENNQRQARSQEPAEHNNTGGGIQEAGSKQQARSKSAVQESGAQEQSAGHNRNPVVVQEQGLKVRVFLIRTEKGQKQRGRTHRTEGARTIRKVPHAGHRKAWTLKKDYEWRRPYL